PANIISVAAGPCRAAERRTMRPPRGCGWRARGSLLIARHPSRFRRRSATLEVATQTDSGCLRPLWLVRPPVGEGGTDCVALVCESEAALSDRVIEGLDGAEAAVGERFIDEPSKMLDRLELGTVGGWNTRRMPSGTARFFGPCPAGVIELKHDAV